MPRTWSGMVRRVRTVNLRRRSRVLLARLGHFARYTVDRFLADDGFRLAAGLSYASLLALVPLLAIALAIVSAFPAFEGVRATMMAALSDALPEGGAEVADRLGSFVDRAERMTGPGVVGLAVTAILLLNNINGAFNAIWRVADARPWPMRLLVYWALLTLGPLMAAASLSLSSVAFGAGEAGAMVESAALARLLAIVLLGAGLGVIYFVVPNRGVALVHALTGGMVAAALVELATFGFGVFLANFPTYEAIYGAFSTLPIFLVWLVLSWSAVLIGAEVAAAMPEWRAARARGRREAGAGEQLALALTLLARMQSAMRVGEPHKRSELARNLPATPAEVDAVLRRLREHAFVARTQQGRWTLTRDLEQVDLGELMRVLGLGLAPGDGWPPAVVAQVRRLTAAGEAETARSLRDFLAAEPGRASP